MRPPWRFPRTGKRYTPGTLTDGFGALSFPLAERSVKPAWKMRVFPAFAPALPTWWSLFVLAAASSSSVCGKSRSKHWAAQKPSLADNATYALSPGRQHLCRRETPGNAIKVRSVASNQVVRTIDLDPMSRFAVRGKWHKSSVPRPSAPDAVEGGPVAGVQVFAVDSGAAVWEGEFRQFQSPLACSANGRFLIGTTGANAKTRYNREYKYFDMPCCTCSGRYVKS